MEGAAAPWLDTDGLPEVEGLPEYGWRVRLDHQFKEVCRAFDKPRLHQMWGMFGFVIRYFMMWYSKRKEGKKLFIDNLNLVPWKPIYGAPIGGIGCGTIGRGFKGEFCRFQMIPGMYEHEVVLANQFTVCIRKKGMTVYQQVLSPHRPPDGALGAWNWAYCPEFATYHALYPRAWTVYDLPGQNVRLVCRQVSPVFPQEYKDTSLPAAVFVWTIENTNDEPVDVSIMFTFKNGQGTASDREGGVHSEPFTHGSGAKQVSGVIIHQKFKDMSCDYAVSAKHAHSNHVSHCVAFDPRGSGKDVWTDLLLDGRLSSTKSSSQHTCPGEELACAVCVQCQVSSNSSSQCEFSLTWDMPIVHFGARQHYYCRWYTKWFGCDGKASPELAAYALNKYPEWENEINSWQTPILESSHLPAWYKSALFNELYFVSDGGTVWLDMTQKPNGFPHNNRQAVPDRVKEYGRFFYLEGHEYRMFNTYDVHHYASFALLMLWPKLQLSLQYDIAAAVPIEQTVKRRYVMSGERGNIKAANSVPHDVGDPEDEPFVRMNAYAIHPTEEWKDLNTKFILQVFRDYMYTKDEQFLQDMYPQAKAVMTNSLRWDTDKDGIIDNGGFADQTYDAWVMTGASAYCGGMWLAALQMFVEMARMLGEEQDEQQFRQILDKAKVSFEEKLWNGHYYNYDSSNSWHFDSIHSDQLAGHWFLKASGIPDDAVFPKDHVEKALDSIYDYNVLSFGDGCMGAVNGMRPNHKIDTTSIQSEEAWVGVTYALAATMIQEGMCEKGFRTAYGAYNVCYNRWGLAFQTPEAYFLSRYFRSLGYMRPLAVWAIQYAIERFHPGMMMKQ